MVLRSYVERELIDRMTLFIRKGTGLRVRSRKEKSHEEISFCKFNMSAKYLCIRRRCRSLGVFTRCLLTVALTVTSLHAQVPAKSKVLKQRDDIRKQVLQPALKMLRKKKVPFDQQLLLHDQWREELKVAFERMPEMKKNIRVAGSMKGVYLAATILLPEEVELSGDTVILVRELAPDDENSTITISGGYRLVIFVIGDSKQYEAMRKHRSGGFLHVNVSAPCGIVGIAPVFLPRFQCRGMGFHGP